MRLCVHDPIIYGLAIPTAHPSVYLFVACQTKNSYLDSLFLSVTVEYATNWCWLCGIWGVRHRFGPPFPPVCVVILLKYYRLRMNTRLPRPGTWGYLQFVHNRWVELDTVDPLSVPVSWAHPLYLVLAWQLDLALDFDYQEAICNFLVPCKMPPLLLVRSGQVLPWQYFQWKHWIQTVHHRLLCPSFLKLI